MERNSSPGTNILSCRHANPLLIRKQKAISFSTSVIHFFLSCDTYVQTSSPYSLYLRLVSILCFYLQVYDLDSFEMLCWRGMEKISWTDRVKNEKVQKTVKQDG